MALEPEAFNLPVIEISPTAYTIFARDGELVPITIERSPELKPGTKVISPKTAQEMRAMLETVSSKLVQALHPKKAVLDL